MASILHGSARTTPRVRAELQASKEKASVLAKPYGLSRTTVNKWRSRSTTADARMGPRDPRSTVLTRAEEAIIVAFRQRTLLPLDDVMGCLREQIPKLTRSSLHRCLERHGISRLPVNETMTKRGRFAETTIGYVHIDSCELRHADGKIHMFLAIDRVSKFTFVEFYDKASKMNAASFLQHAIEAFPYKIHTVLTDNGIAFADLPKNRNGPIAHWSWPHLWAHLRRQRHHPKADETLPSLDQRPGRADEPHDQELAPAQAGDATIKVFHYPDIESLKAHVLAFVKTSNFAKHLKALRWKTPFEAIATHGQTTRRSSRSIRLTSSRDQSPRRSFAL